MQKTRLSKRIVNSIKLLNPNISLTRVHETETQFLFTVVYGDYKEHVVINEPPFIFNSKKAWKPVYQVDGVMYITTPVEEKEIEVSIDDTVHIKTDNKKIHIGRFVRKQINTMFGLASKEYFYTKDDVSKLIAIFSNTPEKIPHLANIEDYFIYEVEDLLIEVLNEKLPIALERNRSRGSNNYMITQSIREILNTRICQFIDKNLSYQAEQLIVNAVEDKIILPERMTGVKPVNNRWLAMNHSPQSEQSGIVVHTYMSTEIDSETKQFVPVDDHSLIPFSRLQGSSPYVLHTYPNRQQVRSAIIQSMDIVGHEDPLIEATTNTFDVLPGLNAHVAFMHWDYTVEDGIIVSESMAERLKAIRIKEETICVDMLSKNAVSENSDLIANFFDEYWEANEQARLNPRDILGYYKGQPVRSKSNFRSLIFEIRKNKPSIESIWIDGEVQSQELPSYTVKSVSVARFEEASKLMGLFHGNKGTCSIVLKDKMMPRIDGKKVDIVLTPEMCKRGISIVRECYDSLLAKQSGKSITLDPFHLAAIDEELCYGNLSFEFKAKDALDKMFNVIEHEKDQLKVLHGYIRITRLDHDADSSIAAAAYAYTKDNKCHNRGSIIIPGIQTVLYSVSAKNCLNEILSNQDVHQAEVDNYKRVLGI